MVKNIGKVRFSWKFSTWLKSFSICKYYVLSPTDRRTSDKNETKINDGACQKNIMQCVFFYKQLYRYKQILERIFMKPTKKTYLGPYITNFKPLDQFGRKIFEEQVQKLKKAHFSLIFVKYYNYLGKFNPNQWYEKGGRGRKSAMRLKSTNPEKEHLGPIIYLHTKFQLPSPIGWGWKVVRRREL